MTLTMIAKYRFSWVTSSSGVSGSEIDVKPRMSEDSIAITRFSATGPP